MSKKSIKIYREHFDKLPERFVKKIEFDLQYILEQPIPDLRKIYLFGSASRGDIRSTSDIDLLIVTKSKLQNRALAADIRWTLDEKKDGVRTDIVYSNEEYTKEPSVFQTQFNRDKKLIMEVIE